jgi:hypothetical protein
MEFMERYANTFTDIHTPKRKGGGGKREDKIERRKKCERVREEVRGR